MIKQGWGWIKQGFVVQNMAKPLRDFVILLTCPPGHCFYKHTYDKKEYRDPMEGHVGESNLDNEQSLLDASTYTDHLHGLEGGL